MKSITQEEPAGCGIACVAIVLNESYQSTKKLFDNPEYASTRGYYCRELIKVLNKKRKNYTFLKVNEKKLQWYLIKKAAQNKKNESAKKAINTINEMQERVSG